MMMVQDVVLRPPGCVASPTSVPTTAIAMPAALRRLPFRAVAGEFIWCRPSTKHVAPMSQAK